MQKPHVAFHFRKPQWVCKAIARARIVQTERRLANLHNRRRVQGGLATSPPSSREEPKKSRSAFRQPPAGEENDRYIRRNENRRTTANNNYGDTEPATLHPKISSMQIGRMPERIRSTGKRNAPAFKHMPMTRHRKRKLDVLLDDDAADTKLMPDLLHDFINLSSNKRRKPKRRLIEQNKRGIGHQRAPDGEHLPLAKSRKEIVDIVDTPRGLRHRLRHPADVEIFTHRHLAKNASPPGHECNAAPPYAAAAP